MKTTSTPLVSARVALCQALSYALCRLRVTSLMRVVLVCLLLVLSMSASAQKSLVLFGLYEEVTEHPIAKAEMLIYYQDSTLVQTVNRSLGGDNSEGLQSLEIDYRAGRYTLVVRKEGYKEYRQNFELVSRRNTLVSLEDIYLKKDRDIMLGEAVIKATRIKMVTRGDTIVYDAAAFDLAEGSMLDALVAQLPGAELKDGQIKVNGKPIESLTVNGEDFFSGSPSVALQNLPAYTVKNIKVYDREAKDAYLTKRADDPKKRPGEEEHLVMDVILKKAYSTGWMSNVEVGYGVPSDRYIGRAFLLGYTDRLRLAAYANLNNIKNTQAASASGYFSGGWNENGELDVKIGGIDYLYKKDRAKLYGNVMLTHEEPELINKESTEQYYNTGNVFGRALSQQRTNRFHLMTSHTLEYEGKKYYLAIEPSLDYKKDTYTHSRRSATFATNLSEAYRLEVLDTLFAPMGLTSSFANTMLSRYANDKEGKLGWLIARLNAESTISIPKLGDAVVAFVNADYRRDTDRPLIATHRAYGVASTQAGTGELIQQRQDWVSRSYNIEAGLRYKLEYRPYQLKGGHYATMQPYLVYRRSYNDQDNNYWQLRQLLSGATLGQIIPPSAIDPQVLALDLNNSVHSRYANDVYNPGVDLGYAFVPDMEKAREYHVMVELRQHLRREYLHYDRHSLDTVVTRYSGDFRPSISLKYSGQTSRRKTEAKISYNYSTAMPSIYYQLGTTNDSDPMNVMVNRPGLHRAKTNSVQGRLYYSWLKTHRQLTLLAYYSHTDRAIAQARFYDRNTGVSTRVPQNVNGNWNTSASAQYTMPFGKNEAFQLNSYSGFRYVHSVDYASERAVLERSVVRNLSLRQQLGLTYRVNKHSFGIEGSVAWLQSRSALGLFDKVSALDYKARANALLHLPLGLELSTDMNLYARRGYADRTLNTTHWVWNASLAKTLLKGNLTLKLTGVDMLGQISNVQHSINAQGRTETWVNTLPSYAMLSLTYRFHAVPKKKQE